MALTIRPITIKAASAHVRRHHRHHRPPVGGLFAVAVEDEAGDLRGVAIIGRPVARKLQDGWTAEVVRVSTDGARNACSMLLGAAWRAARALGYRRMVTYTLSEEGGASLRGAGWVNAGDAGGGSWSRDGRARQDGLFPQDRKIRWEVRA